MKMKGSHMAHVQCSFCQKQSPKFRAYLYDDDQWDAKVIPEGWFIVDEADLWEDGTVFGLCPEHQVS